MMLLTLGVDVLARLMAPDTPGPDSEWLPIIADEEAPGDAGDPFPAE